MISGGVTLRSFTARSTAFSAATWLLEETKRRMNSSNCARSSAVSFCKPAASYSCGDIAFSTPGNSAACAQAEIGERTHRARNNKAMIEKFFILGIFENTDSRLREPGKVKGKSGPRESRS